MTRRSFDQSLSYINSDPSIAINGGDYVLVAAGVATPPSAEPDLGDLALNQAAMRDKFLGISTRNHIRHN